MERQVALKKRYQYLMMIQIIFLLIGTFYDLTISHKLYHRGSFFSEFFKIFGELPMTILALSAAILKNDVTRGKTRWGYGILALLFALMIGFQIPFYLNYESSIAALLLSLFVLLAVGILIKKIEPQRKEALSQDASRILWAAFLSILVINIIKIFWGRMRYFAMFEMNDFSNFSAWYLPQAKAQSDVFKSFPSGHSANAAMILLLNGLNQKAENDQKVFILTSLWLVLVQISRIVDGAHFLSDVAMGGLIAIAIHMILYRIWSDKKYDS